MDRVMFEIAVLDERTNESSLQEFEATENFTIDEELFSGGVDGNGTDAEMPHAGALLEAVRTHRDFKIASASGVPQVKTEMERQCVGGGWARVCVNVPVLYKRSAKYVLFARISTGRVTNEDVWRAIKSCVLAAAATAGVAGALAAYASGGSAAITSIKTTFVTALKTCLLTKAEQIRAIATDVRVELKVDSSSGPWKRAS